MERCMRSVRKRLERAINLYAAAALAVWLYVNHAGGKGWPSVESFLVAVALYVLVQLVAQVVATRLERRHPYLAAPILLWPGVAGPAEGQNAGLDTAPEADGEKDRF
jgi:hypothetical protein